MQVSYHHFCVFLIWEKCTQLAQRNCTTPPSHGPPVITLTLKAFDPMRRCRVELRSGLNKSLCPAGSPCLVWKPKGQRVGVLGGGGISDLLGGEAYPLVTALLRRQEVPRRATDTAPRRLPEPLLGFHSVLSASFVVLWRGPDCADPRTCSFFFFPLLRARVPPCLFVSERRRWKAEATCCRRRTSRCANLPHMTGVSSADELRCVK